MNIPRTIDLRVHTEIVKMPKRRKRGRRKPGDPLAADAGENLRSPPDKWAKIVLALDCETTIDQRQTLIFGSFHYCRLKGNRYATVQQGVFYSEDLDPQSVSILEQYCQAKNLTLYKHSEFMKKIFWCAARAEALIVGFNLPFDLSRLAFDASWTHRRGGGWSFTTGQYLDTDTGRWQEDTYNAPRIIVKPKDGKGAFFRSTATRKSRRFPSIRCLDLKTLVWALQNVSHSLNSACNSYEIPGKLDHKPTGRVAVEEIEYNRQDVTATVGLLNAARIDFDRHPIKRLPDRAYSPASIAKGYFDAMGITPPLGKFAISPFFLGIAMRSYYGGRAECHIRHTPVPVVYTDFLSQYPTVNTLMGLWWILTASDLRMVDATDEARNLLAGVALDRTFEPAFWKDLSFFAQVDPDGDVLPVRSNYNGNTSNIGINPLTSDKPIWYAGPDLVAARILTGKLPKIVQAFKLVATGVQTGLNPTKLRGCVNIDPRIDDFFKKVIEERAWVKHHNDKDPLGQFLKILANSGSYGLFVEVNPERLGKDPKTGKPARAIVRLYEGEHVRDVRSEFIERPGRWYFPPIAALITAAGRLLLAMLECAVTDAGSTYLMCDTDSMAIVASETGGLVACVGGPYRMSDGTEAVKALSWAEVKALAARFAVLNPYDHDVIDSILKIEEVNFSDGRQRQLYGYAISAKRYVLFTKK